MNKCAVNGITTGNMRKPEMNLLSTVTFAICESIVESGGFDNSLNLLDLSALDDCDECMFSHLRKYVNERKSAAA